MKAFFSIIASLVLLTGLARSYENGVVTDPDGYSNLRGSASSSSKIVEKLIVGEIVQIRGREGPWVKVESSLGSTGYLHESRISPMYRESSEPGKHELFEDGEAAAWSGINYPLARKYAMAGRESALRLFFWMAKNGEFDGAAAEGLAGDIASLLRKIGDTKFATLLKSESVSTREAVMEMLRYGFGDLRGYPETSELDQ